MTNRVTTHDDNRLQALLDHGFASGLDEHAPFGLHLAVAVLHDGEVVAEQYGTTAGPTEPLISWSMAKSVTHAMVGILVKDGLLELDAPVDVPGWTDERAAITLQDLLTMTSGLEFVEDYVDDQQSHVIEMLFGTGSDDVAAFAAAMPMVHRPGEVFNYSSGTTNIISAICKRTIHAATGAGTEEFLADRLFVPTGMTNTSVRCDTAGTFIGSSFVYAPARDYLRFGRLYLDDGCVDDGSTDGLRLLPEGWVTHARTPIAAPITEGHWYGAHWWLWDENCDPSPTGVGFDCTDLNGFAAHGYEGQYLVVVPDRDLVVVRLGKTPVERQPEVRRWLAEIIRCFPR